jgi:hypothetical protein
LTTDKRVLGEEKKPGGQCVDETIRDFDAALSRNVVPVLQKVDLGLRARRCAISESCDDRLRDAPTQ